jgi:hypothetical protein
LCYGIDHSIETSLATVFWAAPWRAAKALKPS